MINCRYELLVNGSNGLSGTGNLGYWDAFHIGAETLYKDPNAFVAIRTIIDLKKVRAEVRESILENGPADWEGYVWNNLLHDNGSAGAAYYEMKQERFKKLVLDVLDDLDTENKLF